MPAMRPIADFMLDDVSNWYVRRNRRRFWKSEDSKDKLAAYQTLYEVLITTAKLCAPFIPFISEEIYCNLRTENDPESIHLCDFPVVSDAQKSLQNKDLEALMATAQKVVRVARSLRNETRIRVRQPLKELAVASRSAKALDAVQQMSAIIQEELNVKEVTVSGKLDSLVTRTAKANFKALGPRFGKEMKFVAQAIQQWGNSEIEKLEEDGEFSIEFNGQTEQIKLDEVEIRESQRGDMAVSREGELVVGLSTTITPELEQEGIAREFVNRIQNLRKDAGFDVQDRISIYFDAPANISQAVRQLKSYICSETLANDLITELPADRNAVEVNIDDVSFRVVIEKIG